MGVLYKIVRRATGTLVLLLLLAPPALAQLKVEEASPPTQVAPAAPSISSTRPAAAPGSIASMAPGTTFQDCETCPEMVVIPIGSFTMGSPPGEEGRFDNEGPQHQVTISRPFAAGKFEVTRAQFARFVLEARYPAGIGCFVLVGTKIYKDNNRNWLSPGFSQTDNDPVTCVNWQDAKAYAEWLSRKTGRTYRLLTEAEWEYVARAGTTTAFSFGSSITPQLANYNAMESYAGSPVATSRGQTAPVGSYPPNAFGLHDVHGNVGEWTEDCYNDSYNGAPSDGSAWASGKCSGHVLRGGSWYYGPRTMRSANRFFSTLTFRFSIIDGFRLARTD